ncbi:U-box domain-containing protein 26 [Bienertia sinuspersici]
MAIPEFFKCPISLELLSDPVTLSTGQTYDRSSIEKWLSAGNFTCPVTMQKLHDLSMVPNHTLRHLIDQWLLKDNHHHHHFLDDEHDYGASKNLMFLKNVLESKDSTLEQKMQVLERVRFLSKDLPWKNEGLIQMGFLSLLLKLVFVPKNTQEIMGLVEKSLNCALKLMPFSYLGDLNMLLLEDSKFENFKLLLQQGSNLVKISLCNIIEMVCLQSSLATKELATKIGNDTKILQCLISYLNDFDQDFELSKAGIKGILSLITSSKYRENMVKQGLVGSLMTYIVELVERKDKEVGSKATKALELVLELEKGKEEFMVNEVSKEVIKALTKMVFIVSGDDEGSESAVNCLMILCNESMEMSEEAICGGILTQLLLLLQSQCSGRAKTRARMLLKLLRSMWAKGPKHVL